MRKAIVVVCAVFSLLFPRLALAVNYGEGSYGQGNYNEGETTSTTTTTTTATSLDSSTIPPSCKDQVPGARTPLLYGAIAQSSSSILLYFTEADNPVTKYVLEYGTKAGEYQYGVQDLGINERHQMTYQVNALSPNTTYYFKVRGQNGCATGEWSNEISSKTKGMLAFNQLEFTETEISPVIEETAKPAVCEPYTVKAGDSLWNIAKSQLGDGNRYKEIVEQNKDKYPTLGTSNSLNSGWELKIDCADREKTETEEKIKSEGLDVNVKVVDTKKQPVKGAKVTLHSDPKEAVTDENGVAKFTGVESGEHKVLIAYGNYEGEQSIFLTATEGQTEFNINITIEPKNVMFSTTALIVIGGLLLVVIILVIKISSKK